MEREQRAFSPPTSIASLNNRTREQAELTMESKPRGVPSSTPIRRWSRMSMVDQEEEDYRSMRSEYHNWLTRECANERKDSKNVKSSDFKAEIVPLPSRLPVSTWGTGIVP
ncbi:hypothetical protein PENTCL1PPCAC_7824 [Pristionchus entomophagus]|uniref:Uncharacterized protein n=1 Tax=Pristionchus entomophagus TaxID=358040 RepID=A0AAV5SWA5_9BILA|nr:hypothetical protein PENTCL1PPCAC_7824 [Pristionchus entomophagus]